MNAALDTSASFLFIASDYKPSVGGIASYVDNLARGLRAIGTEARVLVPLSPNGSERLKFLEHYEDWVIPFPVFTDQKPQNWLGRKFVSLLEILRCLSPAVRRLLGVTVFRASLRTISRFKEIVERYRPGMVIFGHLDLALYPFALALIEWRKPYGIIAHDWEIHRSFASKANPFVIMHTMLHGAERIIANSTHTKGLLEMWKFSQDRLVIVNPPISEQLICDSAACSPTHENSYFALLTICRLVKSKGIDLVLHALKTLAERGIRFIYVIAGEGEERPVLENIADELGIGRSVRFLGRISDKEKSSVLRAADVFVMPSRVNPKLSHEGFGMAFIEAATFAVPGVGTRAGGIPDAIVHEETGLLVEQDSPEELAHALMLLYEKPALRQKMGRAAMQRARRDFSPTAIAIQFQNQLSACVEQTKSPRCHAVVV